MSGDHDFFTRWLSDPKMNIIIFAILSQIVCFGLFFYLDNLILIYTYFKYVPFIVINGILVCYIVLIRHLTAKGTNDAKDNS